MEYLTGQIIDFDRIAEHDDVQQTMKVPGQSQKTALEVATANTCVQLLVIFLMATLNTKDDAKRAAYITKMTANMDQGSQLQIMNIKEEVCN